MTLHSALRTKKQGIHLLNDTFKRYQLDVNATKTKTMILNQQYEDKNRTYPISIASVGSDRLENVLEYRYLGCDINANVSTTGEKEINLRIDAGDNKFYFLSHQFFNRKINLKIRVDMLNSLVRSRITHACQLWIISQNQMNKLNAAYNRMLRKMIKGGFKRKENSWSFVLKNDDVLRISKTTPLESFINKQQKNYTAHVIRKENQCIVKRLLFEDNRSRKQGPHQSLLGRVLKNENTTAEMFFKNAIERKF